MIRDGRKGVGSSRHSSVPMKELNESVRASEESWKTVGICMDS